MLLKGSDIKRTSRRTALLKGRNTRTIQLPLRHLKGIGIGMTPLSDSLAKRAAERKRYRRGHRTTLLVSYPDPCFHSSGCITSPLREKWR